ncbi:MAG: hypothetical protein ACI4TX_00410 [Christensenellales bacterium]
MRKYNKKIKEELESKVPDLKVTIKCSIDWKAIKDMNEEKENSCSYNKLNENVKQKSFKQPFKFKVAISSFACVFLVCLSIILPLSLAKNEEGKTIQIGENYLLTIDVNPSIRLEIDSNDTVVSQTGLNKDGIIFLYKENFVGEKANDVTKEIVDKLNNSGFFKYNKSMRVCVNDTNGNKNENMQNKITSTLTTYFKQANENVELSILNHDELTKIENLYYKNDIKSFEYKIAEDYNKKLMEQANQKLLTMQALTSILSFYANIIDDEDYELKEFSFIPYIKDYCNKYNYNLYFELDKVTLKNIKELYHNLMQEKETLEFTLVEIKNGNAESNFPNEMKDLYYLVEDILYAEN